MRVFMASLFLFLFFTGTAQAAFDSAQQGWGQGPLEITRITPDGTDVAAERQIVITFNRPVVPVGRMERSAEEIPVTITPALDCAWRWLNTTSLACQLDEKTAMASSTAFTMTIRPGITTEDGETTLKEVEHKFITERADVRYAWFRTWKGPGSPVIRLTFNQPVTKASVEKVMLFRDEKGAETKLAADIDPDDRDTPSLIPLPSGKGFVEIPKEAGRKSDDDARKAGSKEARRIWLVEPVEALAVDTRVSLMLQPGLVSAEGDEPSVADREVVGFDTYPEFHVAGIRCRTNDGIEVLIKPGEKSALSCNPMAPVSLAFSVPVFRSQVAKNFVFSPALGAKNAPLEAIWGEMGEEYSRLSSPHQKGRTYDVNLPFGLKAAQEYKVWMKTPEYGFFTRAWIWLKSFFVSVPQTALENEFYQKLGKPVTLGFKTSHRKPNYEIVHHEAVLEKQIDSDVPLYVNNLESVTFSYKKVTAAGASDETSATAVPQVQDVQFAVPFGVRKFLNDKAGAVYGHLSTTPPVDKGWPGASRLFAQVTPWQAHVKLGHFSSTVWVTDMQTGDVVSGARVTLYKDVIANLGASGEALASGTTDANGIAKLPGTEKLDPNLTLVKGWNDDDPRIIARIEKGADMALVPLNNDFSIDTWRVSNEHIYARMRKKYGHIETWGTTAQGIYRAGDTIQYKFYVRNQNDKTLTTAPKSGYTLEILDPMDNSVEKIENLTLNDFGAYSGEFKVAKEAPVGWYRFRLKAAFSQPGEEDEYGENVSQSWQPLKVLVSDFTPVPFRVDNSLNGDLFRDGQEVEVQSGAKMHAGGPYTGASARVTAIVTPAGFSSKHPAAADFTFSTSGQSWSSEQVFQKAQEVDNNGELKTAFTLPATNIYYGRLSVETAVQDDRGKYIAATSSADYVSRDRFVGLKSPQWVYEAKKPATIQYIVVDERGAPVKGVDVAIDIEREVTTAAKVKGAGNAYVTNFTTEWVKETECKGASQDADADCTFTPQSSGSYRAVATVSDTRGRSHATTTHMWMTGRDYVLWNTESDVLLTIVPEKTEYRVGDTARYLVKNPFPGAKALVTVERYGVIDSFVQTLEGSTPVIEFPVKGDYLPGFYLSVLVVSPRAADQPVDENQVDLGKPSFRMGYVTVPVKDKYKEMQVEARAAADVYRPRDKVTVKLHAEPRVKDRSEPIEIAVAVLDEAVFDLVQGGAANFDPYRGFYNLDGLDLRNYNLLTRLIGRQKFEKKGANQGGDGGADLSMRDLFKFVAYWNPSLKTDAKGNAEIAFDAPDNLTGWRVLALAVTPTDRMGLGQGTFKVNRPTEVRPVMPNQVTERDAFKAGFSVMNRTDKPRTLDVVITAAGPIDAAKTPAVYRETVTLDPYKRATVFMPVQTAALPELRGAAGEIVFEAKASDATDGDGMVHRVPVNKMRSLDTAATYGTTEERKAGESIAFPDDIYPDVGAVSVVLSPSVIGNLEGAFRYIRDYTHRCWEQVLTKAVMASHYKNLKGYLPKDFEWKGEGVDPQTALDAASAYQAPNGGMAYFIAADEYADPYLSAYTALAFNWLRASGYKVPAGVEEKLDGYLLNLLRNDTAPSFYSEGMTSTVRAVALAALAARGKVTGDDIDRYHGHVKQMGLFGKTHFMQAAMKTGKEAAAKEVANLILSHANQTGGKFIFNEELDDSYARILASPLRENCAILSTFTAYGETPAGAKLTGDVPFKLVRTVTQTRGSRDHWENTQENVFCLNALTEYSRVYERARPEMKVDVSLDGETFGKAKFGDLRDAPVTLERKIGAADVGRRAALSIDKDGKGRLYYATRLQYAPRADKSKPASAGIDITREMSVERNGEWKLLDRKDKIRRGDIVRVDLYLSVPAARNFVAVTDPVPGGLEPVNRDLANTSAVDADKGAFRAAGGSWFFKFSDWVTFAASRWSFYHQELRHDSARFYADYLPAGNYHLSYTAQAIAEGDFTVMPAMAEEMYDPDVYGKGISGELGVEAR